MNVEIRPATPADVEEIQRVAERAWYEAHAPIVGQDTVEEFLEAHYDAESFRSVIDDDDAVLDVAVGPAGTVVGFVSGGFAGERPGTFNLNRIYVHPDRWGEGVGRQLLDHVERTVRRRGGDRIELGVMAENERAVRFYEAVGFDRENEIYDEVVGTDSYIYAKEL